MASMSTCHPELVWDGILVKYVNTCHANTLPLIMLLNCPRCHINKNHQNKDINIGAKFTFYPAKKVNVYVGRLLLVKFLLFSIECFFAGTLRYVAAISHS